MLCAPIESPHRGDSNEYIQYTIFSSNKKVAPNYPKSAAMSFFQGTKNKFGTDVVSESSVFQPLKFYCKTFEMSLTTHYSVVDVSVRNLKTP